MALLATSCASIPDQAPEGIAVLAVPWDARVVAVDGSASPRSRKRLDLPVGPHQIAVTARHEHSRGAFRQKVQIGCVIEMEFENEIYTIGHELEAARPGTLLLNPDFIIRVHRMPDEVVVASCRGNVGQWKVMQRRPAGSGELS